MVSPVPLVDNPGPDRHFYRHVFTTLTGTVAALAILPAFGAERFFKTVVDQGIQVLVRFQPDIAAVTAIAAVRAAFRNIFLAAEAYATIAAVTCYDQIVASSTNFILLSVNHSPERGSGTTASRLRQRPQRR